MQFAPVDEMANTDADADVDDVRLQRWRSRVQYGQAQQRGRPTILGIILVFSRPVQRADERADTHLSR